MASKSGKIATVPRLFFSRYVASVKMPPGFDSRFLPLAHGTSAIKLRDILAEGFIRMPTQACDTLKQRLVFSFYGRPSYIRSETGTALTRSTAAPTYLLLKEAVLSHAAMAHPLDTGAFKEELYKGYIDRELQPKDFGFEPTRDGILKVIFEFFGGNTGYMEFKPRQANIEPGEHEALAYFDVINSRDDSRVDARDSSIEVTLDTDIEINADNVQCVIIPNVLMDSAHYGKLIRDKGIDVRAYSYTPPLDGQSHAGRILDCVLTYYREKGML